MQLSETISPMLSHQLYYGDDMECCLRNTTLAVSALPPTQIPCAAVGNGGKVQDVQPTKLIKICTMHKTNRESSMFFCPQGPLSGDLVSPARMSRGG